MTTLAARASVTLALIATSATVITLHHTHKHSATTSSATMHEHGPDDVAAVLDNLSRHDLTALAVTLAAMVPDDYTPVELLAWNDSRYAPVVTTVPSTQPPLFPAVLVTRQLKPHGTHAAFTLHRNHGEEPCDACWHGEREYQRNRKRNNRADTRRTA